MIVKLLTAALLGITLSATAHATPTVTASGTGCLDGFCLWVKGQDLFQTATNNNPANRYNYVYLNVFPDPTSGQYVRLFLHQFSETSNVDGQQSFSLRFNDPVIQQWMLQGSIHFQVINPESTSSTKWTGRIPQQWKRNKVILGDDFQAAPVTTPDTHFGMDRNIIYRGPLNPAYGEAPGWFNTPLAFNSRISTDATGERYLMARNQVGKWGTTDWNGVGGGITFSSTFCQSPPCQTVTDETSPDFNRLLSAGYSEAFLTYRVNFANCPGSNTTFDFRGGKLPGLAGGSGTVASGGGNNTTGPNGLNGWSARSMFGYADSGTVRAVGKATLYFYHVDMREPRVIPVPPGGNVADYHRYSLLKDKTNPGTSEYFSGVKYGHAFPYRNADQTEFNFLPNRWYMITQRVKLNTIKANQEGAFDGEVQVWVDGEEKLFVKNVRMRHGKDYGTLPGQTPVPDVNNIPKQLDIDSMNFHWFYGGGSADWAPQRESCAAFDEIKVFDKHR